MYISIAFLKLLGAELLSYTNLLDSEHYEITPHISRYLLQLISSEF